MAVLENKEVDESLLISVQDETSGEWIQWWISKHKALGRSGPEKTVPTRN